MNASNCIGYPAAETSLVPAAQKCSIESECKGETRWKLLALKGESSGPRVDWSTLRRQGGGDPGGAITRTLSDIATSGSIQRVPDFEHLVSQPNRTGIEVSASRVKHIFLVSPQDRSEGILRREIESV
jgi:hypothetical protein